MLVKAGCNIDITDKSYSAPPLWSSAEDGDLVAIISLVMVGALDTWMGMNETTPCNILDWYGGEITHRVRLYQPVHMKEINWTVYLLQVCI